ncbi:hypothetical protein SODALDRAFT_167470 [Sodiomyces alkalinus F11]|uniref:RNA-binding protein n=1 Tax=Sodiomyces alkalinus (strain CBS 110278 / VKM F-3762 / F11) TaxID=1314773 RepID=A0A3N2PVW6_SODAK|nr:hypothetical protein SODALDRAFT_167470 [Sodiomyces alkalinus F11]ROT38643.1 hypothetical protein SODALDRAFT_167470 [Sodiomyces alkalinus F11]
MFVAADELPHLKAWLMNKLPEVSDTETDILADYVLALLTSQEGDASQIRLGCESELPPFLNPDATSRFVDDLFRAIESKTFLPPELRPPPAKKPPESQSSPSQEPSSRPEENRKRSYYERENSEAAYRPTAGERAFKQPRRGGAFGRGIPATDANGSQNYDPRNVFPTNAFPSQLPPIDPTQVNPFNTLPTTPAYGLPQQPPPFPSGPQPRPPYGAPQTSRRRRQRCRDFDTKGFCARGNSCQFDHGMGPIYLPSDPVGRPDDYSTGMAAALLSQNFQQLQQLWEAVNAEKEARGNGNGGRGRGGGRGQGQRRKRKASISAEGPVHDKTKSTIVVENIPEEKFSEEEVREFFSQFGEIVQVTMQPRRRLAVIKYDTWAAANGAYRSPKVIFDNRFVKVFWYKEDSSTSASGSKGPSDGMDVDSADRGASAGPEFDMEEFLKKQQEAQRAHEEKMREKEVLERQREELEKRQRELMERQLEEKRKLQAKLRGSQNGDAAEGNQSTSDALRAQLAALEEEAELLGLDPHADDASSHGGGGGSSFRGGIFRGRGRGRGGFPPRGRGSFRAGHRGGGRGGFGRGDVHAAYAAYSLDNRPRVVAISGVDFTEPEKDEALRQHLLGVGEFTHIESTPSSAQITFKDRKTAEKFFFGVSNKTIAGIEGELELSWVNKAPGQSPVDHAGSGPGSSKEEQQGAEEDETMQDAEKGNTADDTKAQNTRRGSSSTRDRRLDMDYEVADDDDDEGEWGIA